MKCHNLHPAQICISRRSDFLVCSLSPIIMEVENGAPGRFEDEFSLQRGQFPLPRFLEKELREMGFRFCLEKGYSNMRSFAKITEHFTCSHETGTSICIWLKWISGTLSHYSSPMKHRDKGWWRSSKSSPSMIQIHCYVRPFCGYMWDQLRRSNSPKLEAYVSLLFSVFAKNHLHYV